VRLGQRGQLVHRALVHVAGDVVVRAAGLGREALALGIQQGERADVLEHALERAVLPGLLEHVLAHEFETAQRLHEPLVDHLMVGVQGDFLALAQGARGAAGLHQRGHAQLAGDGGHVPGGRADVGDDAPALGHDLGETRRGMPRHQHRAVGEVRRILVTGHQVHRPGGNPAHGRYAPAGKQHARALGRPGRAPPARAAPPGGGPPAGHEVFVKADHGRHAQPLQLHGKAGEARSAAVRVLVGGGAARTLQKVEQGVKAQKAQQHGINGADEQF